MPRRSPPQHATIAAALRRRILEAQYPVGSPLPSEGELADEFAVSRGPVRQAMATLRTEGLIVLAQGKPATVRSRNVTQTLDTFTPFTQWAARTGRTAGARTVSIGRRPGSADATEALALPPGAEIIEVVRLRTLDGAPAMLERSSFITSVGELLLAFDTDSGSMTDHLAAHGAHFAAMEHVLDAVGADATDADLLEIDRGTALLRERRTSRDDEGHPFEFADDRYRPDLVTFSITNTRTP